MHYNLIMDYQVAGHQTDNYRINTEIFEGPLDLLLELIQKSELDITRLALAQVTDQYLAYLHGLKEEEASQVSAFLVIAAKLLLIKSETLLPKPIIREPGEEDPGEALAQQLIAYRAYKKAAEWLLQRDLAHQKTYLHIPSQPKLTGKLSLEGITLNDLLAAITTMYSNQSNVPLVDEVINSPRITIREKIQQVLKIMQSGSTVTFSELYSKKATKIEIVVTFLAILELIKQRAVIAQQDMLFSEINLDMISEWHPTNEAESEFGD